MEKKGVDVSYHQGVINWPKVKASGVDFAIIRAGYGKTQMDKQFLNNIAGAITAGLEVGIYWFIYAANVTDAIENAKKCGTVIAAYKSKITMRVWADWEYDSDKRNPQTKTSRTAIVKAFCETMQTEGYEVGVYANPDYMTSKFDMEQLAEYPIWLAKYSSNKGDYEPYMWQHSSKGSIDGISGNVDMNIYYGSAPNTEIIYHILRKGSKGASVTMMQQRLISAGYGCGKRGADGDFGDKTRQAVIAYQAEHNLVVDGVVGENTWKALIG